MTAVRTSADGLLTCPTLRPKRWEVTRRNYFRLFFFWLRPELGLLNRFAFVATRFRYRWTILSPDPLAIRLAIASSAASIFSRTISSASHRALLPPRISFIIRSATTPCLGRQHHHGSEHPSIGPAWF